MPACTHVRSEAMSDEFLDETRARWNALAEAGVQYSQPFTTLDEAAARREVDPAGLLSDVRGRRVLCLAAGGGQQSAAFALLGAQVTVLDLSDVMLERDRQTAAYYGLKIDAQQGDMRDLSRFPDDAFDVVWHAFSLSFVPDFRPVFDEVTRVLKPGGLYRTQWANPFFVDLDERNWTGKGYLVRHVYRDGAEVLFDNPDWTWEEEDGTQRSVVGPREWRHALGAVLRGLARRGFVLLGLWEEPEGDPNAEPGTWEHMLAVAPPWLTVWAIHRPDVLPYQPQR